MNLRIIIISISLSFAILHGAGSTAVSVTPNAKDKSNIPYNAIRASFGQIVSIDLAKKTIAVQKRSGKKDTVLVSDSTIVRLSDGKKTLADLKSGQQILAICRIADGKKTALRIAERSQREKKKL